MQFYFGIVVLPSIMIPESLLLISFITPHNTIIYWMYYFLFYVVVKIYVYVTTA